MTWNVSNILLISLVAALLFWFVGPRLKEISTDLWDELRKNRKINKQKPPPHPTIKCPKCGSNHVELRYGSEEQWYLCGECGWDFKGKEGKSKTDRTIIPHPIRKCPSCGINLVEGVYGDEHQRYRCSRCGQIFQ